MANKEIEEFEKIMESYLNEDWYNRTPLEKQRYIKGIFSLQKAKIIQIGEGIKDDVNSTRFSGLIELCPQCGRSNIPYRHKIINAEKGEARQALSYYQKKIEEL